MQGLSQLPLPIAVCGTVMWNQLKILWEVAFGFVIQGFGERARSIPKPNAMYLKLAAASLIIKRQRKLLQVAQH